jgi:hypothetical protein
MKLENGKQYWLGATWGTYHAESDTFILGNCFVRRYETIFADKRGK